jgi:hypothetical protein
MLRKHRVRCKADALMLYLFKIGDDDPHKSWRQAIQNKQKHMMNPWDIRETGYPLF